MKEFINLNQDKIKLTFMILVLFLGVVMSVKYNENILSIGFLGLVILICAFQLKKMKIKL
jgi:hypothetical protein